MFNGRRQPSRGGTSRMTRECQVRICEIPRAYSADSVLRRCPPHDRFDPRKRTWPKPLVMSQRCQRRKWTSLIRSPARRRNISSASRGNWLRSRPSPRLRLQACTSPLTAKKSCHQDRGPVGFLRFVRRLHSYYGGVRLLASVHHRLRFLTFLMRTVPLTQRRTAKHEIRDIPGSDTRSLCT